ncbi:MAG: hypothetical protein ACOH5I_23040 [Oligoflexus sp.]
MIRMTFLPYISMIVICAISTACASGGIDPTDQQAGFAGAPLEENFDAELGFGDDLDNNFGDLDNNFDNAMFDENFDNGGGEGGSFNNNFGNFDDFGNGETVNSATQNEFDNFGFNNQGGNNFFANQNFENNSFGQGGNNNFFADGGNDFGFQSDNPLQFNNNPENFAMFDDGEGVNNALPTDNEFSMFANQTALDTNINPVVDNAVSQPMQVMTDGSGLVKYVMANGSTLHSQPDSSVIKNLEQGDHPLVFDEGEWSRTSDGFYIPSMTLTRDPIPRRKLKANWAY